MTPNPLVCHPETDLGEVGMLLWEADCGALPGTCNPLKCARCSLIVTINNSKIGRSATANANIGISWGVFPH